jgi:surfactin synthase thioesterase subunit
MAVGRPGVRLICLAQAGAGAGAFSAWRPHVPQGVELAPVELPGRGTRESEPMPELLDDLIEDLYAGLADEFTMPYVLFGHSFGAVLAYELTRRIEQRGVRAPLATVVSGSRAPHRPMTGSISDRDDRELLAWLLSTDGLPRELLRYTEYLTYLMGVIRRDIRFAEHYRIPEPVPVHCPLHVVGGVDDQVVSTAELEHWKDYAAADFALTTLPGGHSYPQTHAEALLATIRGWIFKEDNQ